MEYEISPSQMQTEIMHCIQRGKVGYFKSSPGLGKSSIVGDVAKKGNLKVIDLRLSQCTPEDLQGYPMLVDNKAVFSPFNLFPLENDDLPEGYDGWILFLDELSSASKSVQAAAYKLILDRMVGSYKLHPACAIVAAGNLSTDRAVVTEMSTALGSRLIHYRLRADFNDWIDWASKSKIDYRIIGFLNMTPSKLMDFRPNVTSDTFPCPRTWEFLSDMIIDDEVTDSLGYRYSGTIGSGTAIEFMSFCREFDNIPKLSDIVADPLGIDIPISQGTRFAIISMLMEHVNTKSIAPVLDYINRFPIELRIVFARTVAVREPALKTVNEFTRFIRSISKDLI